MKLSYDISEDDFLGAYERFWQSNKQGTRTAILLGSGGIAFGGLFCALYPHACTLGIVLIAFGTLFLLITWLRRWLYLRAFRENPKFHGPIESEFSEDGISTTSKIGHSDLEWAIYSRASETDAAFLLTITRNTFSIIPKRAFESDQQIEEFRALVGKKLGGVRRI